MPTNNSRLTKKTMLPLGLVACVVVSAVSIFLWVDSEHDSIADTLRTERQVQYSEIKEDMKDVKADVKEVNGKIDTIYLLLIQLNEGGTP